ncbi:MAG: lysozyme family protein [Coriobacteriales bacterium]
MVTAAVIAIAAVLIFAAASYNNTQSKYDACAKWHDTVQEACIKTGLGKGWTDDVLALMFIESGGDVSVSSVTGVANDIMQAAEGEYGDIIRSGSEKYGVEAETPEASIYAGVLEFKQNLKLWDDYLGGIGPAETGKVQLVIQGYNFGADGWYQWCVENDYTIYTVERAQRYSDTMMPSDAKGTPTHAEKWLTAYEKIKADEAE